MATLQPLRLLRAVLRCQTCVGDTFQDGRQPGHLSAAPGGAPADQKLSQGSHPVPPGDPLDDSPPVNCSARDITLTERDKQVLVELRRASVMALLCCVVS